MRKKREVRQGRKERKYKAMITNMAMIFKETQLVAQLCETSLHHVHGTLSQNSTVGAERSKSCLPDCSFLLLPIDQSLAHLSVNSPELPGCVNQPSGAASGKGCRYKQMNCLGHVKPNTRQRRVIKQVVIGDVCLQQSFEYNRSNMSYPWSCLRSQTSSPGLRA